MIFHTIKHFFAISRLRIQWSKNKKWNQELTKNISYKLFDVKPLSISQRRGLIRAHLNFSSHIHLILLVLHRGLLSIFYFFKEWRFYCKIVDVYIISSIKSVIGHGIRPPSLKKRIRVPNDLVHWKFYPKTTIMFKIIKRFHCFNDKNNKNQAQT